MGFLPHIRNHYRHRNRQNYKKATQMKPKVTIITPCYNQAQYLEECVDSVLAQTFADWKMIIVNDCSPDNTEEVAKWLSKKDKRISYISHSKNLGLSAARNTGIFASKTPYILPLDADDKLHQRCLEKMVEAILDGFGDFIYCDYQLFGTRNGAVETPEFSFDLLKTGNYITATTLFKRSDWKKAGGYDETLTSHEDWNLWLKMGKLGIEGYRLAETLFFYRQKEESMITEARKNYDKIYPEILKKAGL